MNDVSVNEGNAGTTTAGFAVSLSATSGNAVTFDWATSPGTAVAGVVAGRGVTGAPGVAPGAAIVGVNVFDGDLTRTSAGDGRRSPGTGPRTPAGRD